MVNKKTTKRSLLFSALALIMCISMLIGSTFAWFTDSVTSSGNKIVAGKLDVQLLMNTGDGYEDISDSSAPIFGAGSIAQNNNAETLWEPGKTQVAYLAIKNNGNLALKYSVALNAQNVSKNLYEVMQYAITAPAEYNSVNTWTEGNDVTLGITTVSDTVSLGVGETDYFALSIHMDEEAGNQYQGGEVSFDITVLATQETVESDSFDNTYDELATVMNKNAKGQWEIDSVGQLLYFAQSVNNGNSYKGETVVLTKDLDLAGINWQPIGTGGKRFQGTFDGQYHIIDNLTGLYENTDSNKYGKAFFGDCTGDVTIKNVTFTNASISNQASPKGNMYAVVCGYSYGNITFENVHVKDSYVSGLGKVAAILAYAADPGDDVITMKKCSVTGTEIVAVYNAAPFAGLIQVDNTITLTDCVAKDNTFVANATGSYAHPYATITADNGEEGIYWVYSDAYNYAAWGNAYTTYDTWYVGATEMMGYSINGGFEAPTVEYNVTSANELNYAIEAAEEGAVINVNDDITVTDSLKMDKSYVLELNGNTLYLSTTAVSYIFRSSEVTFRNGTVDISGANVPGKSGIFYTANGLAGHADGNGAQGNTVNFENVKLYGDGYSAYSVFSLRNGAADKHNTVNFIESTVELKNEKRTDGGFIKHAGSATSYSYVNIVDSIIDCNNVTRLFLYGVYNIKDSTINFIDTTGEANAFRQGQFTIDNSKVTVAGGDKGLSPKFADTIIKNGSVVSINNTKGNDVIFEADFNIRVDSSSTFTYTSVSGSGAGQIIKE